jgi:voltage-gated sodium channel
VKITPAAVTVHEPGVQFERLVFVVIGFNAILLVASLVIDGYEGLFELAHNAILMFFVFELLVRLRDVGWRLQALLRRPWNTFDVVVIGLSLLPVFGGDASLLRLARLSRMVHLLRHVSSLRAVRLVAVAAMR